MLPPLVILIMQAACLTPPLCFGSSLRFKCENVWMDALGTHLVGNCIGTAQAPSSDPHYKRYIQTYAMLRSERRWPRNSESRCVYSEEWITRRVKSTPIPKYNRETNFKTERMESWLTAYACLRNFSKGNMGVHDVRAQWLHFGFAGACSYLRVAQM